MSKPNTCRNCADNGGDPEAEIDRRIARMTDNPRLALASDETYARRLAACDACESLRGGNTCGHCGCYVRIRAKLADSRCPYPLAPKWPV